MMESQLLLKSIEERVGKRPTAPPKKSKGQGATPSYDAVKEAARKVASTAASIAGSVQKSTESLQAKKDSSPNWNEYKKKDDGSTKKDKDKEKEKIKKVEKQQASDDEDVPPISYDDSTPVASKVTRKRKRGSWDADDKEEASTGQKHNKRKVARTWNRRYTNKPTDKSSSSTAKQTTSDLKESIVDSMKVFD